MRSPTVYDVLIASPGDVPKARQAVEEAIHEWNDKHAQGLGIQFAPRRWEKNAVPAVGSHPQEIVNRQFVDGCDLAVVVFGTRIGTRTPNAESGTIEELERLTRQGKQTYVYFSKESVPPDAINPDQLKQLRQFRDRLKEAALVGEFHTTYELKQRVDQALTSFAYSELSAVQGDASVITSERLQSLENAPITQSSVTRLSSRKACLALAGFGTISYSSDGVFPRIRFRNEGEFVARDIRIIVTVSSQLESSNFSRTFTVNEILPQQEREIELRLPRFFREENPREQSWEFDIDLSFRDGLDTRDNARFSISLVGHDPNLRPEYHRSRTEVSSLCRFIEPVDD